MLQRKPRPSRHLFLSAAITGSQQPAGGLDPTWPRWSAACPSSLQGPSSQGLTGNLTLHFPSPSSPTDLLCIPTSSGCPDPAQTLPPVSSSQSPGLQVPCHCLNAGHTAPIAHPVHSFRWPATPSEYSPTASAHRPLPIFPLCVPGSEMLIVFTFYLSEAGMYPADCLSFMHRGPPGCAHMHIYADPTHRGVAMLAACLEGSGNASTLRSSTIRP